MQETVSSSLTRVGTALPIRTMGFLTVLSVMQLWYLLNYTGEGFSQQAAFIYIIIPVVFLAYSMLGKSVIEDIKLMNVAFFGVLGFFMAWAFVLMVYGNYLGIEFGTVSQSAVNGTITMQVLFVAPSEELAFRCILPQYLASKFKPSYRWLALLIPQISFAIFHYGVYSGEWSNMGIALIFGCVLMVAYNTKLFGEKLGLGFCIGAHSAYNLTLEGVLSGGITMLTGGL